MLWSKLPPMQLPKIPSVLAQLASLGFRLLLNYLEHFILVSIILSETISACRFLEVEGSYMQFFLYKELLGAFF